MSKEVKLQQFEGYEYVGWGACAPYGFQANGMHVGLHPDPEKNDLGILYSEEPAECAAVFTTNKVKAAPVLVTREHLKHSGGVASAVIMNCKNANAGTPDGIEKAEKMCELAAKQLRVQPQHVLVASTGVIGQILPIEPIENNISELVRGMSADRHLEAEKAVMTTDTVPKEIAVRFKVEDKKCIIGGMAKGSGMIHPNMATTLNFITTDCRISHEVLQKALDEVVQVTYNCLSVDGDMSTNDMVIVLANGTAGNSLVREGSQEYEAFKKGLYIVMMNLTRMLAKDGEGATKLLEVSCTGAPDDACALTVAKSVTGSNLFKCALFGEDANVGRILCAMGYADAEFDITKASIDMVSEGGRINVCENGAILAFSEELAAKVLKEDEITVEINLHQGEGKGKAWGCDLTYDYVKINGDYRS